MSDCDRETATLTGSGRRRACGTMSTTQMSSNERSAMLVEEHQPAIYRRTDRIFIVLMLLQWVGAVVAALVLSPTTWAGDTGRTHPHVWTAILLGGVLTLFPVGLAVLRSGTALTRHVIAV